MGRYYADHSLALRQELASEIPGEELRALHRRRPLAHFGVVAGLVGALALGIAGAALLDRWYLWLPCAVVAGFAMFNFTVLLHEVVHRTVLDRQDERLNRLLGMLYAIPSGISSSQFHRWHLDHHASLGSTEEDPKRHHLSPKINARWLKLLYFTPALFVIYFRAARREAAGYEPELRKRIDRERNVTILAHLALLAAVWAAFGFWIAFKAYLVPYFFIFPIAFALNRIGQHYEVDPEDPARWSTLVRGSKFWDVVYLCSNYHLEHHYFPGVPLYNLPRLQRLLMPFYRKHEIPARSYGYLFWNYIVLNRAPHTRWEESLSRPDAVMKPNF